jgi:hypothetical protein
MKNTGYKKIYVNPVEKLSYQGRHKQVYTINTGKELIPTVSMKRNREDNVTATFKFPQDPNKGKLVTGLNKQVTNPFHNYDVDDVIHEYSLTESWRKPLESVVKHSKISKQTLYEITDGVEPGFYTDEMLSNMLRMPANINDYGKENFLEGLELRLYPRPNPFDNTTPRQRLLMEMVYVLPQIANSKEEANASLHDWYISEEFEEEQEKSKKREIVEKAIYDLYNLKFKHGYYRSYQVAIVLRRHDSRSILKGKASQERVNNLLSDFISDKNPHQMDNVEQLADVLGLLESKEGMRKLEITYLVQQAINANVITSRDNRYLWHSKAGTPDVYDLGTSFDKMVNFFLTEYNTYNPESEVTNWYKDLFEEVSSKNIWLE